MQKTVPCLWFDGNAEEAVNFYVSTFRDSCIESVTRNSEAVSQASGQPAGTVLTITFQLNGQQYMALNGGPEFKFTEAVSFMVNCDTQEEVDMFWDKLSEGGETQVCGWLKDKFGLSWQVVPTALWEMMRDSDPAKFDRVMGAVMEMTKPDIATLRRAYEGA